MTFKNIFLKIEVPQNYRHTCIFHLLLGKYLEQNFSWLLLTKAQKLLCAVFISQKEIIQSTRNLNDTLIVGSTNYRLSSLRDHSKSEGHRRAVWEEKHDKALKEGISVPLCKVIHNIPAESVISIGLQYGWEREADSRKAVWNSFLLSPQRISFHRLSRPN